MYRKRNVRKKPAVLSSFEDSYSFGTFNADNSGKVTG